MDLREYRIKNLWHILFWILGLGWQLWRIGIGGILFYAAGVMTPMICLFPLFRWRMLGAGDVKLFSALGGFLGCRMVFRCMICSFLLGGAISIYLICHRGILIQRLEYFRNFFRTNSLFQCLECHSDLPSYRQAGFEEACMHFTVPVFLAVLLMIGGLY